MAESEKHELRAGFLVTGLLFVVAAALYLLNDGGVANVDGPVAAAVLLIVAGIALLVRTVTRLRGPHEPS